MEECDSNGTFVAGDNSTSSADFCQQSQQQPAAPQQPQLPAPENTIEQSEQQQRVSECVAKLISTRTNKVKRVAKHRQLQLAQQRHTTNQPNPTILENNNSTSMDVSSSKPVVSSVPTNTSTTTTTTTTSPRLLTLFNSDMIANIMNKHSEIRNSLVNCYIAQRFGLQRVNISGEGRGICLFNSVYVSITQLLPCTVTVECLDSFW